MNAQWPRPNQFGVQEIQIERVEKQKTDRLRDWIEFVWIKISNIKTIQKDPKGWSGWWFQHMFLIFIPKIGGNPPVVSGKIQVGNDELGGGLKHFLFVTPKTGEMIQFDPIWRYHIFQMGWNSTTKHQPRPLGRDFLETPSAGKLNPLKTSLIPDEKGPF